MEIKLTLSQVQCKIPNRFHPQPNGAQDAIKFFGVELSAKESTSHQSVSNHATIIF